MNHQLLLELNVPVPTPAACGQEVGGASFFCSLALPGAVPLDDWLAEPAHRAQDRGRRHGAVVGARSEIIEQVAEPRARRAEQRRRGHERLAEPAHQGRAAREADQRIVRPGLEGLGQPGRPFRPPVPDRRNQYEVRIKFTIR